MHAWIHYHFSLEMMIILNAISEFGGKNAQRGPTNVDFFVFYFSRVLYCAAFCAPASL